MKPWVTTDLKIWPRACSVNKGCESETHKVMTPEYHCQVRQECIQTKVVLVRLFWGYQISNPVCRCTHHILRCFCITHSVHSLRPLSCSRLVGKIGKERDWEKDGCLLEHVKQEALQNVECSLAWKSKVPAKWIKVNTFHFMRFCTNCLKCTIKAQRCYTQWTNGRYQNL